jgi:hypothetical protein
MTIHEGEVEMCVHKILRKDLWIKKRKKISLEETKYTFFAIF